MNWIKIFFPYKCFLLLFSIWRPQLSNFLLSLWLIIGLFFTSASQAAKILMFDNKNPYIQTLLRSNLGIGSKSTGKSLEEIIQGYTQADYAIVTMNEVPEATQIKSVNIILVCNTLVKNLVQKMKLLPPPLPKDSVLSSLATDIVQHMKDPPVFPVTPVTIDDNYLASINLETGVVMLRFKVDPENQSVIIDTSEVDLLWRDGKGLQYLDSLEWRKKLMIRIFNNEDAWAFDHDSVQKNRDDLIRLKETRGITYPPQTLDFLKKMAELPG